jgi:hypothetical protein
MRKTLFLLGVVWCTFTSYSQVNPNAIGIRGGGGWGGNGAEVSFQKGMGAANRLELDFGFRRRTYVAGPGKNWYYNHLAVSGIYHWVWNLTEGLNWYIGPGAQLGFYDDYYKQNSGVGIGIGGQIGLEYDFNKHDLPILVGLDARPMWDLFGHYSGFNGGAAFSIRYTF